MARTFVQAEGDVVQPQELEEPGRAVQGVALVVSGGPLPWGPVRLPPRVGGLEEDVAVYIRVDQFEGRSVTKKD